jgi:hypothetical protein
LLHKEASSFAKAQSKHSEPGLFGVTDGKAIGTFDDGHVSYPAGHVQGSPLYNGKSSGLIGSFTEFGFGFHDWHPNKPFDLYYDDIVLDTKHVGCL